jgi:hypothetical protein
MGRVGGGEKHLFKTDFLASSLLLFMWHKTSKSAYAASSDDFLMRQV